MTISISEPANSVQSTATQIPLSLARRAVQIYRPDDQHLAARLVRAAVAQGGQPLEPALQDEMESRFGCDFGAVRIHTDPLSAFSAGLVGARAYTVGHHLVFAEGQYQPHRLAGRRLLAHELAHVVQQRNPIDFQPLDHQEIQISESPEIEASAWRAARQVTSGCRASFLPAAPASAAGMLFCATRTTETGLYDPEEVWMGSGSTPNRAFNVAMLHATLSVPLGRSGFVRMRTLVTTSGASYYPGTTTPGGRTSGYLPSVRFCESTAGRVGADLLPTRATGTDVEYVTSIPLSSRPMDFTRYVYVKMPYGASMLTFIEVRFHVRIVLSHPAVAGHQTILTDVSPAPAVVFDPYGRVPMR